MGGVSGVGHERGRKSAGLSGDLRQAELSAWCIILFYHFSQLFFCFFGLIMPIYEYRCDSCGFQKEYIQRMSDAPLTECPECKKPTFSKMVTAAGFQLKGGGWYVTDFKGGNSAGAKKTESKQSDAGSNGDSGKAESTKPESKSESAPSSSAGTASSSTTSSSSS